MVRTSRIRERPELLNIEEAADYLNVSPRWLRKHVSERTVPVVRLGRMVRFERRDLDALVERGRSGSGVA